LEKVTRDLFALANYLNGSYEATDKISADVGRRTGSSAPADTCTPKMSSWSTSKLFDIRFIPVICCFIGVTSLGGMDFRIERGTVDCDKYVAKAIGKR